MERLTKHGLLVRRNGRKYLTVIGKVVYELQSILGVAHSNYRRLKAIDSLQTTAGLHEFEYNKLIDSILVNTALKNIVRTKVR